MAGSSLVHCVTSCFFWMVFYFLCWTLRAQDQRCSRIQQRIDVTSSGGVLYSPGYPEEYHNSQVCTWLLKSTELGKVLQLRPLDMQVGQTPDQDGACSDDVLTAFDGDSTQEKPLYVWCGDDVSVVYSTQSSVLLQLTTDVRRRYRGFAIKYSLLTLSDNTCERDQVRTVPLQDTAVVVDFPPASWTLPTPLPSTCSWRLVADDVHSHVVIELEQFHNGLPCQDGNFSVYDGPETSSPEVMTSCEDSIKPFFSVHLTGSQGMVVIRISADTTSSLRFRFYTRPKLFSSCSLSHLPTLEMGEDDPTYISFPLSVNSTISGSSCPVQLLSGRTQHLWARVDLLQVDRRPASCNDTVLQSSALLVLQANQTAEGGATHTTVHPSCWRQLHPVYWPLAESVILSPDQGSPHLLVKVTPSPLGACHGRLQQRVAPIDEPLVIKDPPSHRKLQYSRSSWCRYVIGAEREVDHVLSRVEGELCELQDQCGDYVRIYDGRSTDSPLLYDSKNQNHVTVYVISSGRYVTYEVNTDDKANRGFIHAEFNSVPGTELCTKGQQLKGSRQPQNLSSVNYPLYYPINYMCQYCIEAYDAEDVIYIQVIDSDLTYSCLDVVEVYDGSDSETATEYLGRFCGQDTARFISKRAGVCLLFRSDLSGTGRGWLLSYWSAPPPTAHSTHSASASSQAVLITMVIALILLAVVSIAFIIYIVLNKRRQQATL